MYKSTPNFRKYFFPLEKHGLIAPRTSFDIFRQRHDEPRFHPKYFQNLAELISESGAA